MAFANPYNLSLLLGGVTASILTANPLPGVIALGAEALWLLHGSDSQYLRRILWDPRPEKIRMAMDEQDRNEKMKDLPDSEKERVKGLVARERQINKLASANPSFTGDLLRTELVKTRSDLQAFLASTQRIAGQCDGGDRRIGGVGERVADGGQCRAADGLSDRTTRMNWLVAGVVGDTGAGEG